MAASIKRLMNRGTILVLALALMAALLAVRPVGAQTEGCQTVGTTADDKKAVCYYEFVEHSTGQVARLSALERDFTQVVKVWELVTDPNDPAGDPSTAFRDYGRFRIDRDTAVLTFKSPPDYENPGVAAAPDAATTTLEAENVYKVKAKVGDGEKFLPVEITVQVRGIEEPGSVSFSNRQPEVGVRLTATLADGDIRGLRTPDWQWEVETDTGSGVFEEIDEAVNAAYTPRAASDDYDGDEGKKLKVIARYEDSHGTDYAEVSLESEFAVRAAPASNVAPEFRENNEVALTGGITGGMQTSRRIEENSAPGMRVGPPVFATDNNHLAWNDADDPGGPRDVLTYSLSDGDASTTRDGAATLDDGLFSIDQITGQIMTKAPLNKESGLTDRGGDTDDGIQLQVTAIATDPSGEAGRVTVTIYVLDVDEAPVVMGPAALTYFENQEVGANELLLFRDPTITDDDDPTPLDATDANRAIYMATDNDLDDPPDPELGDIEWQITGPDANKFQFGAADPPATYTGSDTGNSDLAATPAELGSPELQFRSAPDLENAGDVGGTKGDNVYEITVVAWDEDWEIGRRDVTIRVADSNDEGTVTLSHVKPQSGVKFTATLKDQDDVSTTVTWTWQSGGVAATGTVTSSGNTSTYTPTAADGTATNSLTVTATYTDGGGRSETATATSADVRSNAVEADNPSTVDVNEAGRNEPPRFYEDGLTLTDAANRVAENEVKRYDRYVLENQTRNVRTSEADARDYDDEADNDVAATVNVFDYYLADQDAREADPQRITDDTVNLQFDLSGADAKYFSIQNAETPPNQRGLISTKSALNFETKSSYSVTVTATDPAGLTDTVTVTIKVLDVPEIEGLESRIRVDENTKDIADLYNSYPPDNNLGGLKWSLLTTEDEGGRETQTEPAHNRNHARSIDCHADPDNLDQDGRPLCDNFRFSRFNTSNTTLRFAIGTGEDHKAPNYEKPSDRDTGDEAIDNVYKIVVRVAFANLRSFGENNHPSPALDEKNDREVWIRVDDVDEDPKFTDDASTRLIAENSDDTLPGISINRLVVGTVTASDPEDTGGAGGKKLTYSLSLPEAYSNLFQIVPSNGDILTRARLNYEALSELEEMGPDGGQHRIITGPEVTATDSAMPTGNSDDIDANIRLNDVNETPIPVDDTTENTAPAFPSSSTTRTIAENTAAGQDIGDAVAATDADAGDTLTYTLSGADMASFYINAGTGQLMTKAALDFEKKASYTVTVMASDTGGLTDTITVTITVTDVVDEEPVVGDTLLADYDPNNDGTIEKVDMRRAVADYFGPSPMLTKAEMRRLVGIYFA